MSLDLSFGLWGWIALACAIAYATKLLGYGLPARWLGNPRMGLIAGSLTVALLASLTVMNTVASGTNSIRHDVLPGALDQPGTWVLQAKVTLPAGTWRGRSVPLRVHAVYA